MLHFMLFEVKKQKSDKNKMKKYGFKREHAMWYTGTYVKKSLTQVKLLSGM